MTESLDSSSRDRRPWLPDWRQVSRAELLGLVAIVLSLGSILLSILAADGSSVNADNTAASKESSGQRLRPTVNSTRATLEPAALSAASMQLASLVMPSVVKVQAAYDGETRASVEDLETYFGKLPQESSGSGVVIDDKGLIVTNYHVVRGARAVTVFGQDGRRHTASVVGYDLLTDLALLNVPELNAAALPWAEGPDAGAGQLVWAIGCPYQLDHSISLGIISANDRSTLLDSPYQDFLQTDASINPGQSGGALVNADGQLVGITTAIAGDFFQGIGFALPGSVARPVVSELRQSGRVQRGWIGVKLGPVSNVKAAMAGLDGPRGAYVEAVIGGKDSPAVQSGMERGDICVQFQGQEIAGPIGLIRKIAAEEIGKTVTVTVIRDGQRRQLQVRISQRPE